MNANVSDIGAGVFTTPRLRLMLAEDDATQRAVMSRLLTNAGYAVEAVSSGEEALQRICTGVYQILVTDWEMPGMNGATLCRRVREAALQNYLYVLILTGNRASDSVVAGLDAGADDYISKPANPAELIARLNAGRRIIHLEQSLREASEQIRNLSITDPLLGVFNRRYLNDQLPCEIDRARRSARPFSVILADLDRFKSVNDTHGHHAGDEVLAGFVGRMREALRVSDWIARFGGEEFVIALPNTALNEAVIVAEKLRACCTASPYATRRGALAVSSSFGVASAEAIPDMVLREPYASPAALLDAAETLLQRADTALYRSKAEGRDRVTAATG